MILLEYPPKIFKQETQPWRVNFKVKFRKRSKATHERVVRQWGSIENVLKQTCLRDEHDAVSNCEVVRLMARVTKAKKERDDLISHY